MGHCEGFSAAGNAHQRLKILSASQSRDELVDSLRLVAGGRKLTFEFE